MEVIDISKWKVLADRNTTGSRTKYWVKNPSEVCFARPFYTILQRKSTHLCA